MPGSVPFQVAESTDCGRVELVDTLISFLPDLILVVSKIKTSEVLPPEEVFSLVLGLGKRKGLLVRRYLIVLG